VGVNSRNLRTLEVDAGALRTAIGRIPRGIAAVAESGLRTGHDVAELREAGYSAFLIGERLVTSPDPGATLRALIAAASGAGGDGNPS
jgi:indole-3-glycerol phosphate synthase